jgi:DNA topoisomerase-3
VFDTPKAFVCEKSQAEKKPCKFKKIGKEILQRPIDLEQAQKLLSKGKTDLLDKFISGKTGKPFSAYLVLDENGKVGFEFPPRDMEVPATPEVK